MPRRRNPRLGWKLPPRPGTSCAGRGPRAARGSRARLRPPPRGRRAPGSAPLLDPARATGSQTSASSTCSRTRRHEPFRGAPRAPRPKPGRHRQEGPEGRGRQRSPTGRASRRSAPASALRARSAHRARHARKPVSPGSTPPCPGPAWRHSARILVRRRCDHRTYRTSRAMAEVPPAEDAGLGRRPTLSPSARRWRSLLVSPVGRARAEWPKGWRRTRPRPSGPATARCIDPCTSKC